MSSDIDINSARHKILSNDVLNILLHITLVKTLDIDNMSHLCLTPRIRINHLVYEILQITFKRENYIEIRTHGKLLSLIFIIEKLVSNKFSECSMIKFYDDGKMNPLVEIRYTINVASKGFHT